MGGQTKKRKSITLTVRKNNRPAQYLSDADCDEKTRISWKALFRAFLLSFYTARRYLLRRSIFQEKWCLREEFPHQRMAKAPTMAGLTGNWFQRVFREPKAPVH
jgi:hypothetical protein